MKFFILAPAEISSGGPELAHQMCAQIKEKGYDAFMYYIYDKVYEPADVECIDKFKKYGTIHITKHDIADKSDNIIIVPEGLAEYVEIFHYAKVVLWWMSVDNFFVSDFKQDVKALNEMVILHLTQSEYARFFLLKNNIDDSKIITVSDYISEMYGQFVLPVAYRKNRILFNPKKGFETVKPLIELTVDLEWIPLFNMTEEEMVLNMQMAKVYVDFGNHPGKDRIPREAAACGCCVLTNKKGSAAFYEDVPIPDKYKYALEGEVDKDYAAAATMIRDIFDDYETYACDFDDYRQVIKGEKNKFSEDVSLFIERVKGE